MIVGLRTPLRAMFAYAVGFLTQKFLLNQYMKERARLFQSQFVQTSYKHKPSACPVPAQSWAPEDSCDLDSSAITGWPARDNSFN